MLFAALIQEALTPPRPSGVPVKPHTRKPPLSDKREALHSALRAARSVPTEGQTDAGSGGVAA